MTAPYLKQWFPGGVDIYKDAQKTQDFFDNLKVGDEVKIIHSKRVNEVLK